MPISSIAKISILLLLLLLLVPMNARAQNIETKVLVNKDDIKVDISPVSDYSDIPLRIVIKDIGVNSNVKESQIVNGTWEVNDKSANFGHGSSYLDEPYGNTIIFAHARENLFKNLLNAKEGNIIEVLGNKGIYQYKIVKIHKVLPNDINKLVSYGAENLTLFTCEGFGDEYRLVVKAQKINNSKIKLEEVI